MVAYRTLDADEPSRPTNPREPKYMPKHSGRLSHELFHGLTPEEFDKEARSLADAEAMTPAVRERLRAQLTERLLTPPDSPSWGPDWIRHGERDAPKYGKDKRRFALFGAKEEEAEDDEDAPLGKLEQDTARTI